jgi:RNA polymerase sigma-70 factor (ECF subfamily)
MVMQADDSQLLDQFRDPAARPGVFARITEKYAQKLYWHIRRLVVEHEDANDVLQNTLIRAWNGLPLFRQDARLYTWLYRIATNESLNFLEQKRRKLSVSLDDMPEHLSGQLRAEAGFDADRLEWRIQLAIQQLPEKQKLVFSLRYFDEMPYEEMSRVLGTSVGALKASYHHAVKKVERLVLQAE